MNKRSILRTVVFSALILLILFAMRSPQSYQGRYAPDIIAAMNHEPNAYIYYSEPFTEGLILGYSFALTLLGLLFVPFTVSARYRVFGRICGMLLLFASTLILWEAFKLRCYELFTPLTWVIFAALILLGLWALFAFRKKPRAQDAQGPAEAES